MNDTRRWQVAVAGLGISAAALWLVAQTVDVADAVATIRDATPAPLVAILAVVAVQAAVRAWRWSVLVPARSDGTRVAATRLVGPMLIGYLGNAVLPARLGEAMRAVVAARREAVGTTEALGSVLAERLVDIVTLAVVGFAATLFLGAPAWTAQLLGAAAAVGVVAIVVLLTIGVEPFLRHADRVGFHRLTRAREIAGRLATTLGGRDRRRPFVVAAGLSVVAWLLDAASFWLAGATVGAELSYLGAIVVSGVAVLGTAVPSAPGYVGTFELAAAGTATALGVPSAEALALAIVVHAMTLLPLALGGAVSLVGVGASLGDVAHEAEQQHGA